MEYALYRLYKLVTEDIEPTSFKGADLSPDQFNDWIAVAAKEKRNIGLFLQHQIVTATKKEALELQIHGYQASIVQMLDQVFNYKTDYSGYGLDMVYESVLSILEELLIYIERYHYRYFNLDERVPNKLLQGSREELRGRIKRLGNQLLKSGEHDEKLVELALLPVKKLIVGDGKKLFVTYRDLMNVKELLTALEGMDGRRRMNAYYPVLIEVLIYRNFNDVAFKDYLIGFIRNEINGLEHIEQRIEKMLLHFKEISQLEEVHPDTFSIKEGIRCWLRREVLFFRNSQKLRSVISDIDALKDQGEFKEENSLQNEENMDYDLTVGELGLLTRVMRDGNILKNKNINPMMRRVARIVHTKYQREVSADSLYNSFHTVKEATAKSLYGKLVGMVNVLQRIRGEMR